MQLLTRAPMFAQDISAYLHAPSFGQGTLSHHFFASRFASFLPPACTGSLPPPDRCSSRSCLRADLSSPPKTPGEESLPPHPFPCPLSPSCPLLAALAPNHHERAPFPLPGNDADSPLAPSLLRRVCFLPQS